MAFPSPPPSSVQSSTNGRSIFVRKHTTGEADRFLVHSSTVLEVFAEFDTSTHGIKGDTIQSRRDMFGYNVYSPVRGQPWLIKYGKMYLNGFSGFFVLAGILCLSVYKVTSPPDVQTMYLGIALLVVVFITGTFDCYQHHKSEKALTFNRGKSYVFVVRDDVVTKIDVSDVVVGDLIQIESGNRICADMRVVECHDLLTDHSALTGETEPLARTIDYTSSNPIESANMCFAGTFVTQGKGMGVVYAVGDETVLGKIAKAANKAKPPTSNMEKELTHFVRVMSVISLVVAAVFVILGAVVQNLSWIICITLFIAGILSNVPCGLLPQLTVQIALTAKRMAKRNVIVKNSKIIETIGICTAIASDKTGTLTENRMTVSHLWFDTHMFIHGTIDDPDAVRSENSDLQQMPTFRDLLMNLTLNNNAEFCQDSQEIRGGNATDSGFLRFTSQFGNASEVRSTFRRHFEVPFNSRLKWAVSVNEVDGRFVVFMKGAVERILERCSFMLINGEKVTLTESDKTAILKANKRLSGLGERVLAFSALTLPNTSASSLFHNDEPTFSFDTDMVFTGLVSVVDPPRKEVPDAIKKCQAAGIQVIMVTGDHPYTATAIARNIGIISGLTAEDVAEARGVNVHDIAERDYSAVVIHGDDLDALDEDKWRVILSKKEVVFARTLPEQKQEIVKRLQSAGHKVVVTGDGTNDCPAMRQAECGIAMGKNGTEIARDAAAVVLMDDNFASIAAGIEEGRLIFENMKKCVCYSLCHCFTEIFPFLLFLAFGFPLAMETIMVLLIDLGTEMAPAISMAFEEAEADVMLRPPRDLKTDKLSSYRMFLKTYGIFSPIESIISFGVFLLSLSSYGFPINEVIGLGAYWTVPDADMPAEQMARFMKMETNNMVFRERSAEFGGSFEAYRMFALDSSQTAYLWGLVLCQISVALSVCKATNPFFCRIWTNPRLFVSFGVAVTILSLGTWVPGVKTIFSTERIQMKSTALAFAGFFVILPLNELLKFFQRRGALLWLRP